jgi:hypothetical protein
VQRRGPHIHALACLPTSFDESLGITLVARAGSCIAHAGRTVHAGVPGGSGAERLVYVLVFRGPPRPRDPSAAHGWLEGQHTADAMRARRWRRHGGFALLCLRGLRRAAARLSVVLRTRGEAAPE